MLADREDIEARIVGELRRGEGQQAAEQRPIGFTIVHVTIVGGKACVLADRRPEDCPVRGMAGHSVS
jgi:hypothetical protein